jgi:hypothetical protein
VSEESRSAVRTRVGANDGTFTMPQRSPLSWCRPWCSSAVTPLGGLGGVGAVAGAAACGELVGAAGNAVGYGITAAQTGKFSLSGLAGSISSGAISGALGGFLGGAGGEVIGLAGRAVVGGLLSDGAATAATRKPPPPAA